METVYYSNSSLSNESIKSSESSEVIESIKSNVRIVSSVNNVGRQNGMSSLKVSTALHN